MAINIDIDFDGPATTESGVMEIINNVCSESTLGYEDLYAGVHLTGDEQIRGINKEFRDIDASTDVLSFPLLTAKNGRVEFSDLDKDMENGLFLIGDIIISTEKAAAQAEEYGHSYEREIAFLTCHGMLHLLGYDHKDKEDERLMLSRQNEILNKLGYLK